METNFIRSTFRISQILTLVVLLGFSVVAQASNGLRVITAGPVSLGRGGAGVAKDPTSNTIFINPAGMNDVVNQADLSFTVAFPNTKMGTSAAPAGNPDAVLSLG